MFNPIDYFSGRQLLIDLTKTNPGIVKDAVDLFLGSLPGSSQFQDDSISDEQRLQDVTIQPVSDSDRSRLIQLIETFVISLFGAENEKQKAFHEFMEHKVRSDGMLYLYLNKGSDKDKNEMDSIRKFLVKLQTGAFLSNQQKLRNLSEQDLINLGKLELYRYLKQIMNYPASIRCLQQTIHMVIGFPDKPIDGRLSIFLDDSFGPKFSADLLEEICEDESDEEDAGDEDFFWGDNPRRTAVKVYLTDQFCLKRSDGTMESPEDEERMAAFFRSLYDGTFVAQYESEHPECCCQILRAHEAGPCDDDAGEGVMPAAASGEIVESDVIPLPVGEASSATILTGPPERNLEDDEMLIHTIVDDVESTSVEEITEETDEAHVPDPALASTSQSARVNRPWYKRLFSGFTGALKFLWNWFKRLHLFW